jgi:undecaprenyl-diphosphatase
MLETFQTIILGVIEGITEFLPISSTAHLIMGRYFLGINTTEFLNFFIIFIQLGAISAVPILYFKRLISGINIYLYLITSFIPAIVFGLLLDDWMESIFDGYWFIAISWILGGIVLIKFEDWVKENTNDNEITNITYLQSVKIGLFQCLAMIPGVSRSGATIIGGRLSGLNAKSAIEYSFLLGIPTILGASAKKVLDYKDHVNEYLFGDYSYQLYLGFIISFIVALFSIKWMVGVVHRFGFKYFGYYRVIIGLSLIIYLSWK